MDLIRLEGDLQLAELRYNADQSDANKEKLDLAKKAYEQAVAGQKKAAASNATNQSSQGNTPAADRPGQTGSQANTPAKTTPAKGGKAAAAATPAAPVEPEAPTEAQQPAVADDQTAVDEDASKKNTEVS